MLELSTGKNHEIYKVVKKDHQKNTNHKFNFWFFTLDRLREICFDIECYN